MRPAQVIRLPATPASAGQVLDGRQWSAAKFTAKPAVTSGGSGFGWAGAAAQFPHHVADGLFVHDKPNGWSLCLVPLISKIL